MEGDAGLPADEQVAPSLETPHLRWIALPFSDHTTIPGTIELLGAVNTWLREILGASGRLGPRPAATTIEERKSSVSFSESASSSAIRFSVILV